MDPPRRIVRLYNTYRGMEQVKKIDWAHIRRGGHRFEALIVNKKSKRHIAGWSSW